MVAFKIQLPEAGAGSGKDGRVVKIDYVRAVLKHFFSRTMDPDTLTELIKTMMGKKVESTDPTDTPETHLKLLAKLDAAEAPHFAVMKKAAVDALAEKSLRAKVKKPKVREAVEDPEEGPPPAIVVEPRTPGVHVRAPAEFRSLLPPAVDYVYFRWEPQVRRVAISFERPGGCTLLSFL